MIQNTSDDVALALSDAPIDDRTGNKVLYSVSWIADKPSMIGERNEDWVRREIRWFAGGSNRLEDMEPPVPGAFQACAGDDGTVNSAYGHILFGNHEENPDELPEGPALYDRIVNTFLREGADTRHAVAIISDRDIHNLAHKNGRNDFICTNALNVMIDDQNRLHIIAQMRSMDAVWGYRADYSMWDYLMNLLLQDLAIAIPGIQRGHITFQVANLHVYPRHFDLLAKWADKIYDAQEREMRQIWAGARKRAEAPEGPAGA
ncbi:thymidylate synthase [Microbacterium phage Schubert]|uniref:Thymidylate synthase n=1 Tax=Microbacterium phage Schubert TaxID=2500787 RepID=A0A3T0INT9_9CAUD|nr:thymidylate synthase [Microbacterium phage Schubert]AZV01754.1 thymidylate synthase [Microbacterium phage Schubert]